jgi:hypothetical protein
MAEDQAARARDLVVGALPFVAPPLRMALVTSSAVGVTGHTAGVEAPLSPPAGAAALPHIVPLAAALAAALTEAQAVRALSAHEPAS